jgi:hypothetical protein
MKTYYSNEEVKKDIVNGVLAIEDDVAIAFDGFSIDADIKCKNIYSKSYKRNINCGDIKCGDVKCWDVNCGDINCWDIKCNDINCWDIKCGDVNCGDINYYAVCCAYGNIKCKSIKSKRTNAKYFCLDGKITIKEDKKEKVTLELTDEQLEKVKKIIGE